MVFNIIIAVLAFLLAGLFPLLSAGLIAFVIWLVILHILAGFIPLPQPVAGQRRWLY